jgi:glycosyltransferase involved in cell wall biosynthesis
VSLTVLSVAYPLAPVGPDAVGGAEQVLAAIDRALVRDGHRSLVIAQAGSRVAGELLPVPAEAGPLDGAAKARVRERHRAAIAGALARHRVDLVHLHGIDFPDYLPHPGPPALATLHLPPDWYPPEVFRPGRPDTWLHCVSASQHAACPESPALLEPIENGVPVDALRARHGRRRFALTLARICPEKGVHLALDAARRAGIPLLVAGEVFPYAEHVRYFREEVEPRLDRLRRFVGPLSFARKRRFLTAARCLIVPSLVPEMSSLVAREALACGTPVVALARGGLPDAVDHGRTGFLVDDLDGMAQALGRVDGIDREACRRAARERFSLDVMQARYLALYRRLVRGLPARGVA